MGVQGSIPWKLWARCTRWNDISNQSYWFARMGQISLGHLRVGGCRMRAKAQCVFCDKLAKECHHVADRNKPFRQESSALQVGAT
jgi:hypothetical protein